LSAGCSWPSFSARRQERHEAPWWQRGGAPRAGLAHVCALARSAALGWWCGGRWLGWGRTAAPKRMSRVIWLEQRGGGARSQKLAAPQHRRQGRPGNNLSTGRSRPSG